MVNITLPDGDIKAFEAPLTGMDIAKSISEGLARDCVAMEVDDKLVDLTATVDHDARIRLSKATGAAQRSFQNRGAAIL
jgi:threonyl-tRNA synthetase